MNEKRLLLVEDHSELRLLIAEAFFDAGFEVVEAEKTETRPSNWQKTSSNSPCWLPTSRCPAGSMEMTWPREQGAATRVYRWFI